MYRKFVKPTQAQLLELLKLDKSYSDGKGNFIFDHEGNQFLDATGSYGANNLGHGNSIREKAANFLLNQSLSFTQGSIREEAAKLAQLVNEELNNEDHNAIWISQFANTGTEAVEIAIKISKKNYFENLLKLKLELNEQFNKVTKHFQRIEDSEALDKLEEMRRNNEEILSQTPKTIAVENAFHGKTSGSLKLTYNNALKEEMISKKEENDTIYIKRNDKFDLVLKVESSKQYLEVPSIENEKLHITSEALYPICAFIAEPILGEAGILELTEEFLSQLREHSQRIKSTLIFDEVQTGVYRTGTLSCASQLNVTPDIFTFAKGLSGGFAKIGLAVVNEKALPEGFDHIQSSTFAEDDLSSFVAAEVIRESKLSFNNNLDNILGLKLELEKLCNEYPSIYKEVRGRGTMLAIQFNESVKDLFYEFKYFGDSNLLGHLFSSALLNNENIRIAPTLSNQFTLRVQPSLLVNSWEILKLTTALKSIANAILAEDSLYFFQHILGEIQVGKFGKIEEIVAKQINEEFSTPAVFLNHPIENDDVRKILPILEHTPDEVLEELMMATFDLQNFAPYYSENVTGENERNIDIVMLSFPVTSKILLKKFRSRNRHKVAKKIQQGVDIAKSLGATTVGLGQFTSIVSKNGMLLDNKELNLTTGNSFTAKLAYDAGIENSEKSNSKVIGLVGYGGNIISTIAQLALKDAKKLVLFHRSEQLYSQKIKNTFEELVRFVIKTNIESPLIQELKERVMENLGNLSESLENFDDLIQISNDLSDLKSCDLIYTGTNSIRPIITKDKITENTTIIDLAVPGDACLGCQELDGVQVIKGGIAQFPTKNKKDIRINIPSFPLERNESFACMAETFSIGLSAKKGHLNIGPIAIEDIMEISEVAKDAGFTLFRSKKQNSL
jgi:acetylornithine/succinyldiaminopimelate/putrescine aminotransferase/predicted amino acid dehydrogenase